MPEVSVKDQIKKLIDLQKIDSEIYALKASLAEKPLRLGALKDEFEKSKAHLNALEEKFKAIQLKRRDLELELKTKESDIAKANTQLTQIKTNKEYQAKISEIESLKADKSIIEEKILLSYDETDALQAELNQEKSVVAEKEKVYGVQRRQIEEEIKLLEDRLKVMESQRKQALVDVDKNILIRYEKILGHKNGLAVAAVQGNSCGGCYMNVTAQKVNSIKMHDQLVECEMCQRILYIEDDL